APSPSLSQALTDGDGSMMGSDAKTVHSKQPDLSLEIMKPCSEQGSSNGRIPTQTGAPHDVNFWLNSACIGDSAICVVNSQHSSKFCATTAMFLMRILMKPTELLASLQLIQEFSQ
ncbi:MAG: hypothetical protein AAGH78_12130, partial [Cyanobacteria bacterium P01_H01_bin.58]